MPRGGRSDGVNSTLYSTAVFLCGLLLSLVLGLGAFAFLELNRRVIKIEDWREGCACIK